MGEAPSSILPRPQITSTEVEQTITLDDGQTSTVKVAVWNATVANLTLMALGSSAPEILLSCIEISSSGFYAGELGPSTIVGSAAFNMLVISAVCILAKGRSVAKAEPHRRVKYLVVHATWHVYGAAALSAITYYVQQQQA